jgi:hypothetical protein
MRQTRKTSHSKTDQAKLALQRLALDREVHEHLGRAVVHLREAARRAAHRPAARAVEDKLLYARIRQAAISLARAVKLLRPEPEPPKHYGRKLAGLVLVAGGAGALVLKRRRGSAGGPIAAEPVAAPQTPAAPTPETPAAAAASQPSVP